MIVEFLSGLVRLRRWCGEPDPEKFMRRPIAGVILDWLVMMDAENEAFMNDVGVITTAAISIIKPNEAKKIFSDLM